MPNLIPNRGNYKNLLCYRKAEAIYDITSDMPSFHSAGPESDPAHPLGGVYAGRDDRISVLALLDALQDFFTQAFAR